MAVNIVIPSEGQSMDTAFITKWYVKVGDQVEFSAPLCEVESDKASFDVESPIEGPVLAVYYGEQVSVSVSQPIAVVGAPGERVEETASVQEAPPAAMPDGDAAQELPQNLPSSFVQRELGNGRIPASPKAAAFAREQGISLEWIAERPVHYQNVVDTLQKMPRFTAAAAAMKESEISSFQGTGLGGRVTTTDLARARVEKLETGVTLSGARKVIAEKMLYSLQSTAQFTLTAMADATRLLQLKKRLSQRGRVTVNDLVCYAVVKTIQQEPAVNGWFENGQLTTCESVHLGIAVDAPRGLMVPVVHGAQTMNLAQLSSTIHELAERGRNGKLLPGEMKGGSFTVSNLGMMGIRRFTPILNPPELAILGVGCTELCPVRRDEEVCFVDMLNLSLTVNHQIIDGAAGSRFLQKLTENIENIDLLGF